MGRVEGQEKLGSLKGIWLEFAKTCVADSAKSPIPHAAPGFGSGRRIPAACKHMQNDAFFGHCCIVSAQKYSDRIKPRSVCQTVKAIWR